MRGKRFLRSDLIGTLLLALASIVAAAPPAAAQQQGSAIAGVVRDTSGGILPGVTVEVRSPALIEGVRTVFTDSEGRYNAIELRPGTYSVTFILPGFSTFVRDGITLTAGFTATVNADMQVGALEETITVTGAAPLVDTQNVVRQTVVTRDLLDELPTSVKDWSTLIAVTPGFSGSTEISGQYQGLGQTFHGKGGTRLQVDGMGVNHPQNASTGYRVNSAMIDEMVLLTSGISAETNADGPVMNMIPKEGSNTFAGTLSGLWTGEQLEADNLTDELRARGLQSVSKIIEIYDSGVTFGGPIKRDKLWFFGTLREWGNRHQLAGVFWNATQGTPFYTPDLNRPADRYQWYSSKTLRLTWQATQKNKFNGTIAPSKTCQCRSTGAIGNAVEAANSYHQHPAGLYQLTWTSTATSRLLFEGGVGATIFNWPQFRVPGVEPDHISIVDQALFRYNARAVYNDPQQSDRYMQRFSVAYVTGSHNFKFGFQNEQGLVNYHTTAHGNVNYRFNRGVPNQITQYATPYTLKERGKWDLGLYAQDQWTINRLTVNYGIRYDHFNAYVPAQTVPATPNGWIPERRFDRVDNVPNWHDISPRVGATYDVHGDGRTAIKAHIGRFVARTPLNFARQNNPVFTSVNQVNRAWNDADRDYVPDCDLGDFAANGECGPISNRNFGGTRITTRYADDVLSGWGNRQYNWDLLAEIQHHVTRDMSVTVGYYRNWHSNFTVTDNLAVGPGDYDPYSITAPVDPRLPGGGGYTIPGLYNINPAKFGQVESFVTQASNFGDWTRVNDFIGASINTRFPSGIRLGGGFDTGRTVEDECFVVDSPQELLHCRIVTPFRGQTQVKVHGSIPLPSGFSVSAMFQNTSGPEMTASYAATNAQIAPSLGRDLAGRARTVTVPLIQPATMYGDRFSRLDLRLSNSLRIRSAIRLQLNLDLYNALNSSAQLRSPINSYGPRWLTPLEIMDARIVQFSGQLSF